MTGPMLAMMNEARRRAKADLRIPRRWELNGAALSAVTAELAPLATWPVEELFGIPVCEIIDAFDDPRWALIVDT